MDNTVLICICIAQCRSIHMYIPLYSLWEYIYIIKYPFFRMEYTVQHLFGFVFGFFVVPLCSVLEVPAWIPTLTSLSNGLLLGNMSQITPPPQLLLVLSQQQKSQILRNILFFICKFSSISSSESLYCSGMCSDLFPFVSSFINAWLSFG